MPAEIITTLDFSALDRVLDAIVDAAQHPTGPMRDGVNKSAETYLVAMEDRFPAEGNGWEDLAPETVKERERLGYSGPHLILTRSGTLEAALERGAPGNVFRETPDGVEMGIGGGEMHPGYLSPTGKKIGGDVTIGQVASALHNGTDRIPARPILVDPEEATIEAMGQDIADGLTAVIKAAI